MYTHTSLPRRFASQSSGLKSVRNESYCGPQSGLSTWLTPYVRESIEVRESTGSFRGCPQKGVVRSSLDSCPGNLPP